MVTRALACSKDRNGRTPNNFRYRLSQVFQWVATRVGKANERKPVDAGSHNAEVGVRTQGYQIRQA